MESEAFCYMNLEEGIERVCISFRMFCNCTEMDSKELLSAFRSLKASV